MASAQDLLHELWCDAFDRSAIGPAENFFELGGDSLLAMRVLARADRAGCRLSLGDFLRDPTLAACAAAAVMSQDGSATAAAPEAAPATRGAPLSAAQEQIWFLDRLLPGNPAYNLTRSWRLHGALDVDRLERALDRILERHGTLRSRIVLEAGVPLVVVDPHRPFQLARADLSSVAEAERDAALEELLVAETSRSFDLRQSPLLRALLVRLGDDDYALCLGMHHIVSDWASWAILYRELAAFYAADAADPSLSPPAAYADVIAAQLDGHESRLDGLVDFWKQALQGAPAGLDLPTDRARPPYQSFEGSRRFVAFPPALSEQLAQLGARQGTGIFVVLLSALQTLLHRLSGQDDLVIGVPCSTRTSVGSERMIGLFLNTLAVRTDLADDPAFVDLLERSRAAVTDAMRHQELPFGRVVREVRPGRDASRNPLFQVLFSFGPITGEGRLALDGCETQVVNVPRTGAQFDMTLYLWQGRTGITGGFEYSTDLFDEATIDRVSRSFQTLLEAVVAHPDARISELPLLDDAEEEVLVRAWNQTARELPRDATLSGLIQEQADRTPDAVAVVDEKGRVTYAELMARAESIAAHLRARGVARGSVVGLYLSRSSALVASMLGVLRAGAAYLPLDSEHPEERVRYMLDDAGVRLVLTDSDVTASMAGAQVEYVRVDAVAAVAAAEDNGPGPCSDDLAYVIYTSGSTGRPKGVEITHRSLVNCLTSMRDIIGLGSGDALLAITTVSFDIAGLELFAPLLAGACTVVASRAVAGDARRLAAEIGRAGITVMQATPATWQMLVSADWRPGGPFKALTGGEALSRELAAELVRRVPRVWNVYGPTETTIWSTATELRSDTQAPSIGRPIANTRVYILDRRGRPVPVGVAGELCIAGAGVARGYRDRPDLTAERFVPDPWGEPGARMYRTGDEARYRSDGDIEWLRRLDHQVKVRGHRIELGEIEAVLSQHDGVSQAVVVLTQERSDDVRLIAYVVPARKPAPTPSELRTHLRERLPAYMIPQHFVELASLPLTANGKVNRRALPAPVRADAGTVTQPPRTEAERLVAAAWKDALGPGAGAVGVHDNFFDLGGHSLLSLRVLARIEAETGSRIEPRAMILQTLEQIAAQVAAAE